MPRRAVWTWCAASRLRPGIIASVYRDTTAQMGPGGADRLIARATRPIESAVDAADAALAGDPLSPRERSALPRDLVTAIEDARAVMSSLLDLGGTAALSEAHPLQRYWRDMETGSQHVRFHPFLTCEDYGRPGDGVESPDSLLL